MESVHGLLNSLSGIIWGPFMLTLLLGVGIFLTIGIKFVSWRKLVPGFIVLWKGRKSTGEGEVTPFQALMTALSATIGTGNIAGVATAIFLGGPGALFWMWLTAFFGMATKFSEAVLAVKYRETDEEGRYVGGPMYYIKNGLEKKWHWLAYAFSFFAMIAGLGIGNMVQANSVADAMETTFHIPNWITGLILSILVGAVILGGLKRIAQVAEKLVPFMTIFYFAGALTILFLNITEIPAALMTILDCAFNGAAATGGFAGAAVWAAIRFGVARGVFSNEAGLGSAPIAHAAAKTNIPVQQGMIGMIETFIDTIIVCTMTGLVIIVTGVWTSGETGAALTTLAFNAGLPSVGAYIVAFGLITFAFTTLLGWSYYGERSAEFLFGIKSILPYRILWIIVIPLGAMGKLSFIWLLADVLNGLMAIPNLIALLMLSPVVFSLSKDYFFPRK